MTSPATQPSPMLLFDTVTAYQRSQALKAAVELDLFTAIGECGPVGWKYSKLAGGGGTTSGVKSSKMTTSMPSARAGLATSC